MSAAFTELTPGLWVTQSALFATNSGVLIDAGQACLIDPGIYPAEVAGIARFVAAQGATPALIALTHSHWDHVLGPESFPGVPVLAHAAYRDVVRDHPEVILGAVAAWERDQHVSRARPFAIPLPDRTFAAATTLTVGGRTLQCTHAPGHASDQWTLYDPASSLLWAADMLSDREIPFVSHNLAAYRRTLAALAERDIRALVPGHGQPTTDPAEIARRLRDDRAYLDALHAAVAAAVHAGKTVEETVIACAGLPYRHPADNAGPHRWNVESAYLELGGPADPGRVGWSQEWAPGG